MRSIPLEVFYWSVGDGMRGAPPLCCAIGNFDGVHDGHHRLLAATRSAAEVAGMPFGVVTFSPHPRIFFAPDAPPFLLTDNVIKYRKLEALGVEYVLEVTFNEALRQLSPEAFTRDVLSASLNVGHLFAGSDFCFGKGRSGSLADMAEIGKSCQLKVTAIPLHKDLENQVVSSSQIRDALRAGDVKTAARMLGDDHIISGVVEMGDQRGRVLSFPTANIQMDNVLQPAFGVYAITASVRGDETVYHGVCNIGRRPTVNDRGILAEAHLFDFEQDIYGEMIDIRLKAFLRPEQKFDGLEALTAQIARDATAARRLLTTENH